MKYLILILVILISSFVVANQLFIIQENSKDIPSPISPMFIEKIKACGKLDLIDRASSKYNPHALVDGSLKECDN